MNVARMTFFTSWLCLFTSFKSYEAGVPEMERSRYVWSIFFDRIENYSLEVSTSTKIWRKSCEIGDPSRCAANTMPFYCIYYRFVLHIAADPLFSHVFVEVEASSEYFWILTKNVLPPFRAISIRQEISFACWINCVWLDLESRFAKGTVRLVNYEYVNMFMLYHICYFKFSSAHVYRFEAMFEYAIFSIP